MLDIPAENILKKERLHPGKMLLVDTQRGMVVSDEEIKEYYAKRNYGEWLDSNLVTLQELKIPNEKIPSYTKEERARLQKSFGYTYEDTGKASAPWL